MNACYYRDAQGNGARSRQKLLGVDCSGSSGENTDVGSTSGGGGFAVCSV